MPCLLPAGTACIAVMIAVCMSDDIEPCSIKVLSEPSSALGFAACIA